MKFTKPDAKALARMTPYSIKTLLDSLKTQREQVVKPFDDQIAYYEELLKKKEEAQNAKAAS